MLLFQLFQPELKKNILKSSSSSPFFKKGLFSSFSSLSSPGGHPVTAISAFFENDGFTKTSKHTVICNSQCFHAYTVNIFNVWATVISHHILLRHHINYLLYCRNQVCFTDFSSFTIWHITFEHKCPLN